MPYNGAGTYAAPSSTFNPAVTNTAINSTDWNALLADVTTALSTCLLKDGQQTPTANIPMGGFKFTGLAAGSAAGNSLRYEQLFKTGQVPLLGGIDTAGPVNETKTTVASATSPDIWTLVGNVVDYTGTVTATGFAAAPQAGSRRTLICSGAAPFTAGANMLIDGIASGATYTATAGDQIQVTAVTTTQFRLVTPNRPFVDSYPVAIGSSDGTKKWRVEVDGFTTGNTRVFTPPDADLTLPAVTAKGDMWSASASGVMAKTTVGADGTIWTADAASTGGAKWSSASQALTLLGSGSASSSASIAFTSLMTSTYDDYVIKVLNAVPATSGSLLIMQMSTNNGVSYFSSANDYAHSSTGIDASGVTKTANSGVDSSINIGGFPGAAGLSNTAADGGFSGTVELFKTNTTTQKKGVCINGISTLTGPATSTQIGMGIGIGAATGIRDAAVTAIKFLMSSGNIASGDFYLYGVRKS